MGDQLGGTGQILPLHVFLDMPRRIAQERVPTASNVGSRDVTWASQPTPVIPFGVFWRVSRGPFLRQSGVVTETQFLIVFVSFAAFCALLFLLYTGYRWATVFEKQSGTLRAHGLRGPCEHATPVFRLANTASFVVVATPRCVLESLPQPASFTNLQGFVKEAGSLLHF